MRTDEQRAVAREEYQRPIKPEKARPRVCALCGWTAKAVGRALLDCGDQYLCDQCTTPLDERRAREAK